ETVRSRNRNITVRQAKTEAMAAAAAELGALSDDVEVFDVTVEFSPGKVALIQVTSSDGTGSRAVAPNRLKEGLTRIFSRESQLERTAALFGLPAEDLLAILAESAVDTTDASAGLP